MYTDFRFSWAFGFFFLSSFLLKCSVHVLFLEGEATAS